MALLSLHVMDKQKKSPFRLSNSENSFVLCNSNEGPDAGVARLNLIEKRPVRLNLQQWFHFDT